MRRRHNYSKSAPTDDAVTPDKFLQLLGKTNAYWLTHAHLVEQLAEQPLLEGNVIEPLFDGDQAYPAMLAAIEQATSTITLCTYILIEMPPARSLFKPSLLLSNEVCKSKF